MNITQKITELAKFEKSAKTIPADLAKVDTEPRAQIATDLSEYLKG